MSAIKVKDMTIKYTDLDVSRISASELQENERSRGQKIAYPRYDHPIFGPDQSLMIQCPFMHIISGGVPRISEYYENDSKRGFVKTPLDESNPDVLIFINKIKEADALFSSYQFASKLLGPKYNKYKYQPLFRKTNDNQDDDDDEDTKKKVVKKYNVPNLPYIKLKIDTEYGTGNIKTQLYRSEMINNKRIRTEINDIMTIDDFAGIVCFQSKFRPIIRFIKFWAHPSSRKDPEWGAIFKIIKAEVEPPIKNNSMYKEYMNADAFLDSDDDNDNKDIKLNPVKNTTPDKKVAQVDSDDSDDDSDEKDTKPKPVKNIPAQVDSDDSDEEDTVPVKNIPAKVAQVNSDDSDNEDTIPVKKTPAKKVAQVDSDDDDNINEKAKPIKKAPAKKVAQVDSDDSDNENTIPAKKVAQVDSDDSDNEDTIPVKKAPAKKVAQVNSDDSDNEDTIPVKKTPAKKLAQVESDDDNINEKAKSIKKAPAKKVAQVDSDDSDNEDTIPVKKTPAKKVAQVESDDDDNTNEKAKPIKKALAKKVAQDDSDDDDDKPPQPVKKTVSKTTRGKK